MSGSKGTILLADDQPIYLISIALALTNAGYRVERFDNGKLLLDRYRQIRACKEPLPVAIVTDWHMPEPDGKKVAAAIRRTDRIIPIIMASGEVSTEENASKRRGFTNISATFHKEMEIGMEEETREDPKLLQADVLTNMVDTLVAKAAKRTFP